MKSWGNSVRNCMRSLLGFDLGVSHSTNLRSTSTFTPAEQEIIILFAVWELISEMVNYEIFEKQHQITDAHLMPKTVVSARLFNILLVDFLSPPNALAEFGLPRPKRGQGLLFYLKHVCEAPHLNSECADAILGPVEAFSQWLEADCVVKNVWFPSINVETDLTVKRKEFIAICGNIAKHNLARLDRDVSKMQKILGRNGVIVDSEQCYLIIPEFYEWFHVNVIGYHISAIAEFLNNIRWGIYEYLGPEFQRSYVPDDPPSIGYRFTFPTECDRRAARAVYWDLMNAVRSEPYFPKFEVWPYLKMRY